MPAGFTFIDQYRTMAKDLEQQSCDDMLNFEPEPRHFLEADIKSEIKLETEDEPPYIYNMAECITYNTNNVSNNNSSGVVVSSIKNSSNIFSSSNHKNIFVGINDSHSRLAPALAIPLSSSSPAITRTTTLSQFSCSASPMMSSSVSSNYISTKTSTFVTELAGSGCTVVTNTDFILDNNSPLPPPCSHDDSLEYTDLDKPTLYDEYGLFSHISKQEAILDESSNSVPLEEAVYMMTGTLQSDCDNIGVPCDPMVWSAEHVGKWVSWVCQRNHVPDVSPHLHQFDGRTLCSLNGDTLSSSFGDAGVKISNELELLKAANNCFPSHMISSYNDGSASSQRLCNPYMENFQTFNLASCVSPALSSCSSTHDSNTSTISTHSDHSDDESGYGSQISAYSMSSKLAEANDYTRISAKVPSGRGHKQTIHLWQFLKELLLSKDNNYNDCIRWLDCKAGVFKIEDSKRVASLWGARKNRPAMNYDKLSRSVRQYYKKGIIKKTEQSKRLVYQFCPGYM